MTLAVRVVFNTPRATTPETSTIAIIAAEIAEITRLLLELMSYNNRVDRIRTIHFEQLAIRNMMCVQLVEQTISKRRNQAITKIGALLLDSIQLSIVAGKNCHFRDSNLPRPVESPLLDTLEFRWRGLARRVPALAVPFFAGQISKDRAALATCSRRHRRPW